MNDDREAGKKHTQQEKGRAERAKHIHTLNNTR
jgi:hypothetical protein